MFIGRIACRTAGQAIIEILSACQGNIVTEKTPANSLDLETHPIVFFDGECGLCHGIVKRLLKLDRRNVFRYAPLQGETAARLLPESDQDLNSMVFVESERTTRYSAAAVRVLWRLGPLWSFCGCFVWLIPKPLRDALYRAIAARRYRVFGKVESCSVPSPESQQKFLP